MAESTQDLKDEEKFVTKKPYSAPTLVELGSLSTGLNTGSDQDASNGSTAAS